MSISTIVFLCTVTAIVVWGVTLYNNLVANRNNYKNAFAQIDVQLRRRYELIPNLVETAKAYMKHERDTLEAVTQARNQASSAAKSAAENPGDGPAMASLAQAEGQLGSMLGRMFALMENYPDLKANTTMNQLMEELTTTENKVAFSRQSYNDAVMFYNVSVESFPSNLLAGFFKFTKTRQLDLDVSVAKEPVAVDFAKAS